MRYPLTVEMDGRSVMCVGGGPIAAAKVVPMAGAGAVVTVVSPTCTPDLAAVAQWEARGYEDGDLAGLPAPLLVVAATADRTVDDAVAAEAERRGIWCLRIDGQGSVAVPAMIRREGLLVSMTTGAPALTRRLRMHLDQTLEARWVRASTMLTALRSDPHVRQVLADVPAEVRRDRWRSAVDVALGGGDDDASAARAALLAESGTPFT